MNIDDPELDPDLAAQYEAGNPWGDDEDFFVRLVNGRPGARVVDLGCGIGRLAIALASAGHPVLGVEPNPAFLGIARARPGAENVTWRRGTSRDLPDAAFDVALMTSHVAQVFLSDDEWGATLADLRRTLVPGGVLAFDSRDPDARAWETWAATMTGRTRSRQEDGSTTDDVTTMTFDNDIASFESAWVRSDGSRPIDPTSFELKPGTFWSAGAYGYRFRNLGLIRTTLDAAGFTVDEVFGGWHGEPVGNGIGGSSSSRLPADETSRADRRDLWTGDQRVDLLAQSARLEGLLRLLFARIRTLEDQNRRLSARLQELAVR